LQYVAFIGDIQESYTCPDFLFVCICFIDPVVHEFWVVRAERW